MFNLQIYASAAISPKQEILDKVTKTLDSIKKLYT